MPPAQIPTAQALRGDLKTVLGDQIPWLNGLVGHKILKVQRCDDEFFEYHSVDPLQYIRTAQAKPGLNGAFNIGSITGVRQTGNLNLYQFGAQAMWRDKVRRGTDRAEKSAAKRAYAGTILQAEIDIKTALYALLAASGTTGQTSGAALTNAAQDPIEFWKDGMIQVYKNSGMWPDLAVVPQEQFLETVNHPLVISRLNGGGSVESKDVIIAKERFAKLIGVKNVEIAGASYVAENATTATPIWTATTAFLFVTGDEWHDDVPMVGATMRKPQDEIPGHDTSSAMPVDEGVLLTSYDVPNPPATVIVATVEEAPITHPLAARAGYRIDYASI
ncbi:MAG TPA: hypothetical protein VFF65_07660 [Phycisphaerales bacterium]|nr:hypothetical protein [Phycisphaerales bacterium]